MSTLYVMCGIPGSGKSTWLRKNTKPEDKIISRDEIRFSIIQEGEEYFSREEEVFEKFCSEIKTALNDGYDVYADATHINRGSRKKLLQQVAIYADDIVAIEMPTAVSLALKRNEEREGLRYVPPSAIKRMYSQYEPPDLEEGFNDILIAI